MRYKLFTTKEEAEQFIPEVQSACDAVQTADKPKIIICAFPALGKWAVSMPVEPENLTGEIVDTVEPPKAEMTDELERLSVTEPEIG
jgi:hypothetical protein